MSSLARRGMRTTAAAAGIVALGVGLSGYAFAAPEAPALPRADGVDALPAPVQEMLGSSESEDAEATEGAESGALPDLFAFEAPSLNMAEAPGLGELAPAEAPAFEAPAFEAPTLETPTSPLDGIVNADVNPSAVEAPESDQTAAEESQVGAMPGLDSAGMFSEMVAEALSGGPAVSPDVVVN